MSLKIAVLSSLAALGTFRVPRPVGDQVQNLVPVRAHEPIPAASTRAKYRNRLPQLDGGLFLTDGGLETTLVFHEGWDLPCFAAFVLLDSERGQEALRNYFDRYAKMAVAAGAGFILEAPTWRANPDWGAKVGYGREDLARNNDAAVALLLELRGRHETVGSPMVVSGAIGPRGDGYDPGALMSASEAADYHAFQIGLFRDAGADLVSAFTMTNIGEAQGIALAAKAANMPCVISFTVETDGRLPTGDTLAEAIGSIDTATGNGPVYYMINCAHPTHFSHVLAAGEPWVTRLRGIRANSSRASHAELDNAPELDIGDPQELGKEYADLLRRFPHINVLGGCCGTDHRHVGCISTACRKAA
jgi:S-methylmethionine-dependent homocysteine/selenocysteine methylase